MLPFDNKSEFQVVIDMPEGTPLEKTLGLAQEIGGYLGQQREVVNYQIYAGTSGPITSTAWCGTTFCAAAPIKRTSR